MQQPGARYSTGLSFLDYRIGGGLPVGEILALVAPPESQSALLLRQLIQQRTTTFISTIRTERDIRSWGEAGTQSPTNLIITSETSESIVEHPEALSDHIEPESFVILDRGDGLEYSSREKYRAFLNTFGEILSSTDSVGLIHCNGSVETPPQRNLTLSRADNVWRLELLPNSREIKTRLLVTKSRTGRALREPIDLLLSDKVEVDTSRSIA